MIKYSIIIPVYNTGKYLKKCLESVVNQKKIDDKKWTYEVIVINDGSSDNSMDIINDYKLKYSNIKLIDRKNSGVSVSRNIGVKNAKGDYLIFVDSDDYVSFDFLYIIDKNIGDNDVLRFQMTEDNIITKEKKEHREKSFDTMNGKDAFMVISSFHYVETPCSYVFKTSFYKDNKFEFKKGRYYEDYGLIPYVIYSASSVKCISESLYYYVQHSESVMHNTNYEVTVRKAFDMLEHFKDIKSNFSLDKKNSCLSYMANCVIVKAEDLKGKDRKKYISYLKKEKIYKDILTDSFGRKLKSVIIRFSIPLYLSLISKK